MEAGLFDRERRRLQAIAYRMLGSVSDAEDAVQDAWLRLCRTDPGTIAEPSAWLVRVLVHLCIDRLRSRKRSREDYVGPWLPEPLVEAEAATPPPGGEIELADDLSVAFLLALERLSPLERAVFVLHDLFGASHADVGRTVERSETACRKIASRARRHVQEARPRYPLARDRGLELAAAFLDALKQGDASRLASMLSRDAVLLTDGGGKAPAAYNPILGPDRIVRFLTSLVRKQASAGPFSLVRINGLPGFLGDAGGHLTSVALQEDHEGRIAAIYSVRDPDKLKHLRPPSGTAGAAGASRPAPARRGRSRSGT